MCHALLADPPKSCIHKQRRVVGMGIREEKQQRCSWPSSQALHPVSHGRAWVDKVKSSLLNAKHTREMHSISTRHRIVTLSGPKKYPLEFFSESGSKLAFNDATRSVQKKL